MKPIWIFKFLLIALIPVSSYAGDSDGEIENRLNDLEKRISALEQNPAKLSKQSIVKPTESSTAGWKIKANWRALKKGMSEDEVKRLLGDPEKIETGFLNFWRYKNGGSVTFHSDPSTVYGWNED